MGEEETREGPNSEVRILSQPADFTGMPGMLDVVIFGSRGHNAKVSGADWPGLESLFCRKKFSMLFCVSVLAFFL